MWIRILSHESHQEQTPVPTHWHTLSGNCSVRLYISPLISQFIQLSPCRTILHIDCITLDTANYGPKAPTQWPSRSGVTPEIGMERTTRAPGHQCASQCWRTPPSWRREPLDNLKGTQPVAYTCWPVSEKWGFSNEQETCDCGIRQTIQHLLVCPMMDIGRSPQYLAMANGIAIGCARHWENIIWRTYDSWWKDKNDDE